LAKDFTKMFPATTICSYLNPPLFISNSFLRIIRGIGSISAHTADNLLAKKKALPCQNLRCGRKFHTNLQKQTPSTR
ncbi:MAG: hypothetical protein RR227_03065, partial [Oscillospiraceae bacterium]